MFKNLRLKAQGAGPTLTRLAPHLSRTGWSTLDALAGPTLSVFLSPILLHRLDAQGFGLWAFAIALSGFAGVASFGVGVATTKYVAEERAAGQLQSALATTRAALSVALAGAVVMILAAAAAAPWVATIWFSRMGAAPQVAYVIVLGISLLALQEIDSVFAGALRGAQRFDLTAQVEIVMRIVWLAAVIAAALATHSAVAALLASVAANAVKLVIKAAAAQYALGGLCCLPSGSRMRILRVFRLGRWLWIQALGGLLFSVVDRLVVGGIFGAAGLARYSLCMQLAQLLHGVQSTALQPLIPWMSSRAAAGHRLRSASLRRIAGIGGMICMAGPLVLLAFADSVLRIWIGPEFALENSNMCRVLLAAYTVLAFNVPAHYLLIGLGSVRFLAGTNIVAGLVSLSISLALSSWGLMFFVVGKLFFAPFILLNFFALNYGAKPAVTTNKQ